MEHIYLDHAATTPTAPEVIAEMQLVMREIWGNPSSIHQFGRRAKQKLTAARQVIAASIGAKEHEIIFTSGGTEGDNTAILQTAFSRQTIGKHIMTTKIEHPAVLRSMDFLEQQGFEVTYLPVDEQGRLSLTDFKNALRMDTILVSIMTGNNEIGNLLPIREIGVLLADHPAYFHTDAVQAYGIESLDVNELSVDLLNISAHKLNGPRGVGFLYCREGHFLPPLMHGGEQEEKRRAGTENLPGICGLARAVEIMTPEIKDQRRQHYLELQNIFLNYLTKEKIDFKINGDAENKLPHILNLWIKGIPSDLLLMHLDLQGIAISTGSACTAGNVEPSHVLSAMYGKDHPAIKESVRLSFGVGISKADIQLVGEKFVAIINKLRQ